jgi:hypothetical protein
VSSKSITGAATGKPPISAHPAFPVIVALWFAALLGIGSLVLPAVLFERAAAASGIADMVPAAQPPLGVTARIAIALAAAVLGAVGGLFIARKAAAAQGASRPVRLRAATLEQYDDVSPAKRPISAREELGSDTLDAPVEDDEPQRPPLPGRRRALSVTDESGPSDFLEFAPLPGARFDAEPARVVLEEAVDEDEAFELSDFAEAEPEAESDSEDIAVAASFEAPAPVAFEPEPEPAPEPQVAAEPVRAPLAERPLGELGIAELIERFALSLEQKRATHHTPAPEPEAIVEPEPEPEIEPEVEAPVRYNPLGERGRGYAPDPVFGTAALSRPGAPASFSPAAPSVPAALRPLDFGDAEDDFDEGEAALAALSLPIAAAEAAPKPAPLETAQFTPDDDEFDEAENEVEEGYSSLLAMKSPFGTPREAVRIDDDEGDDGAIEPVVVFPGQHQRRAAPAADGPSRDPSEGYVRPFDAPPPPARSWPAAQGHPEPGETEQALRDALEKLQKMSGAA